MGNAGSASKAQPPEANDETPLLKKLADATLGVDDYEPLQLWLIPILLRSRKQYYQDAVDAVKRQVEEAWSVYGPMYESRKKFDDSGYIKGFWRRASLPWWGLNDIVGFIDIRANVVAQAIESTLFLTTKRPSRTLVNKTYVARAQERVLLVSGQTNDDLIAALDAIVMRLASDDRLKRRHVDIDGWRIVLRHTNLLRIVVEEIRRRAER